MSRPKSVKYGSGEIVLKNLTEQEKLTVTKLLEGPETQVVETEEGFSIEPVIPVPVLNNIAFSFVLIGNKWCAATVGFNPETKQSGNMVITELHTNKNIAYNLFMRKMDKEMK